MRERNVEPGSQKQVILLLAGGWIGHVNIGKRVLPSQPFADLGHGAEIEGGAVLARIVEVGIEIKTLGEGRAARQFMHEFVAQGGSRKIPGKRCVRFVRVVYAGEDVERGLVAFDQVKAEAAAEDGAQIERLQAVGLKIAANESKQSR